MLYICVILGIFGPKIWKRNIAILSWKYSFIAIPRCRDEYSTLVSTNLLWNEQCNTLYAKANSRLGLTKRTCHFTKNKQQKRALYLALVRSLFQHCSVIWRPHTIKIKNKLDSIQKRGIKWILSEHSKSYSKVDFLVKQRSLDILPINEHLLLTDLILFHKIFYEHICIAMPDYIQGIDVVSLNATTTRMHATARELSDNLLLKCKILPKKDAFINSFFTIDLIWSEINLNFPLGRSLNLKLLE